MSLTIQDVIDSDLVGRVGSSTVLGVDIGSRAAKAVLLHDGHVFVAQVATGVNMQSTATELIEELFADAQVELDDIDAIVGTGYGRIALHFEGVPTTIVTEISCHAMGAHYLNAATRTIIDKLEYRVDVNTFERDHDVDELRLNEIGRVHLRTSTPLVVDPYSRNRATGSFILIDESTNDTVGAGMIRSGR